MRITCIGGGPAGLYFALLMKKQDPRHEVTLVERNAPSDTFGWGVVFSDQTLGALQKADPKTATQILDAFNHWDDIDVHFKGRTMRSSGHGFCGIGRKRLLNILQERCAELGVTIAIRLTAVPQSAHALGNGCVRCCHRASVSQRAEVLRRVKRVRSGPAETPHRSPVARRKV